MYKTSFRRLLTTFTRVRYDGSKIDVQVKPSYAHKPKAVENLMKGLPELLNAKAISSGDNPSSQVGAWEIDESGDTIHRHVSLSDSNEISSILQQIEAASRELKHDPHTYIDGANLTISCTTHVPPGLSMKDVKLAKQINAILESVVGTAANSESAIPPEQKQRAEERNMEAIRKAKEDCSCG